MMRDEPTAHCAASIEKHSVQGWREHVVTLLLHRRRIVYIAFAPLAACTKGEISRSLAMMGGNFWRM